jgi:hypothetical protein
MSLTLFDLWSSLFSSILFLHLSFSELLLVSPFFLSSFSLLLLDFCDPKTKKDEKEKSHKSETNKDATRKSRSDKDSGRDSYHRSQKSSKSREKDDRKKGGYFETS